MAPQKLHKDDAAQVGIGTMIVFIATILVAAVAAGVLIDTSQKLQDKSTQTGSDAISAVGTNLEIVNVIGYDSDQDGTFEDIFIDLQPSPGAESVDTTTMQIQYNDGAVLASYEAAALGTYGTEAANTFWAEETLRDSDTSFCDAAFACTAWTAILNDDDLVRVGIGAAASGGASTLTVDTDVVLNIDFANGSSLSIGFTTPPSLDGATYVELF